MSWPNIKKDCFEVLSSLTLCNNNEPFLDQIVMGDEKWGLYDNQWWPVECLDQEDAPKLFPKPNLHQKMVMVIVCWSAARLIYYSFLNPGKTITSEKYAQQIDKMHPKLQCLQPALVNRKVPIVLHNDAQLYITQPILKSWTNWATKFCLICHIHLTSRQLITLTTFAWKKLQASWHLFAGKMLPQPTRGRTYFPRVHQILKHRFLHYRNIQTYFSWTKMCWL